MADKYAAESQARMGHLPNEIRAYWDNDPTIRANTALEEIYFKALNGVETPEEKLEWIIHRCIGACNGTPWEVGS